MQQQQIIPVNELFTHNSDNSVKPIIGNKEIEKQGEQFYNKEHLPFQAFNLEEVCQGIDSQLIENHFENIFNALLNSSNDKYNILCYFECITQNSNVANRLINSAFMNLLLKLLKVVKQQQTKVKIGSILGYLIRHATVIENELSQQGIPQILIDVLKNEKNEKVKRKCIAALGEYLFYGATQIDEDPSNSVWQIQPFVVQFMVKLLRTENEDEYVKYYTIKTIENITAQSVETGQQFSNSDTCLAIISLYLTSNIDGLRISSMVSLQHMAMLNNSLSDVILVNLGGQKNPPYGYLKEVLLNGQNRVQQALLTIINLQILISESELTQFLLNDLEFIENIIHLFDNPSLVVRGKAILSIFLIIKINQKALILLAQTKFFHYFEKISRDNQKYVQQCFCNLKQLLEEMITYILKIIFDELCRIQRGELADNSSTYYQQGNLYLNQFVPILNGNLQYLSVLLQYANCSQLSTSLFQQSYLELIFDLLNIGKDASQEVKSVLVNLYEVLLGNKQLLNYSIYFAEVVVPKLVDQLKQQNDQNMKFNYLKLIVDILSLLFSEENSQHFTRLSNFFLKNFVSTQLGQLLDSEEQQVQIMALKLLNLFVEKEKCSKSYIQALKSNKLINKIIEQFTSNRTALKLLTYIIQYSTLQEINSYNVTKIAVELFKHYILKQQDQCYEDLVDIFLNITTKLISSQQFNLEKPSFNNEQIENHDYLLIAYDCSFGLLNNIDFSLSEKVGMFIIQIIFLFGKNKKILKNEYVLNILNTINQFSMVNTMMRRNIRVLNWIVQVLDLNKDLKENIYYCLEKLKKPDDQKVVATISEIKYFLLKN
ncbi:hypothetical protein IMG5_081210 [Ichthyophthirius multifiliis]|uniref:Serine/threonine-protein kinase ULK4/RUNKEL HEAT repeats domain-containing protein n=1 Tax=Ichthyophthirius multifiliis TaxID=5932 RepID=G0QQM0_ICHMU|nr:hypothetical protein IMG5_081210 [Ichthyophthirius multifiliis]EGR32487.1 hypothetical protein IMG5_081210 [Ichthyophthirius multifiliis]|eukprot:XP_004036473.1 hypothetical protein IMG5_081210 [Ichthyophthirius multifiliis]